MNKLGIIINFQIIINDNFLENSNDLIQIQTQIEIEIMGFIHNLNFPNHPFKFVNLFGLSLSVHQ